MSCCADSNDPAVLETGVGEDFSHVFTVVDESGQPVSITGYKLYFIVKVRMEDKNWVFFKRSLNASGSDTEAVVLDQTTNKGQYRVFIDAKDSTTKCPSVEAPYFYGTWVVSPSPADKTTYVVRKGDFNLLPVVRNF